MRVAHFTDTDMSAPNGIVTSIRTLRQGLAELGCRCLTVAVGHSPLRPVTDGDQWLLRSLPTHMADFRLSFMRYEREIARVASWAPDVVHVHTPGPVGALGVFAARRLGIPHVHTYHTDLHSYAMVYGFPTVGLRVVIRLLRWKFRIPTTRTWILEGDRNELIDAGNAMMMEGASAVILPSPAMLRRRGVPVDPARIHVIPTPADPPERLPAGCGDGFRDRHGISRTAGVVLFVGRANREKNVELLLAGLGALRGMTRNEVVLLMVGPLPGRRGIVRAVIRHGLEGRVVFTGPIPHDAVWEAYLAGDVLAFPSLTDTQGIVIDEALAAGLPVVVADPTLLPSGAAVGGDARGGVHAAGPCPREFAAALRRALGPPGPRRAERVVETARAGAARGFAEAVLRAYRT